ncbi:MAG TPA: hypothetical protein VJ728_02345 [Candidatus Binataceae bacterium]|nr:hypothetical protein [Candidatus Binataceae bacterium]
MKAKIFRILGVIGFVLGIGSLSACFVGPPAYPRYAYHPAPVYTYPEPYPRYVPAPRYYVYNQHPYPHYDHSWGHEEHHEHHDHHHDHDRH